jgi:hypothetical protein
MTRRSGLLPKVPLLRTESPREFDALCQAVKEETSPTGIIEQIYVADFCHSLWEMYRFRRCKVAIINARFTASLTKLLEHCLAGPAEDAFEKREKAQDLAARWLFDEDAREEIAEILGRFKLDESSVEADAIRKLCAELELLDRMQTLGEVRRNKALEGLAIYRRTLAPQLRQGTVHSLERVRIERPLKRSAA